jgi:transposase InsO family protein
VSQETRDEVVAFIAEWSGRTGLRARQLLVWLGVSASTYHDWQRRRGQPNRHNSATPREFWLLEWERATILAWHEACPDDGYRRLAYMMLDAGAVAVSPATVYRVLHEAGRLKRWNQPPSAKGRGFVQPARPHQHWHIDVSHLNIGGTFYYLCSILDGYSRAIVAWQIGESMREGDIELVVQHALEAYPGRRPRVISDNGPQFVAQDFKQFVRLVGLAHVRTSPYYPQSNGKKERWYKTLKSEAIRKKTPLTLADAREVVGAFVEYYNERRLHSALGYVTPRAMLEGQAEAIAQERRRQLSAARQARVESRRQLRQAAA